MKKANGMFACVAILALSLIFWFSSSAYSGEPYAKTIYKNKNWKVTEAGIKGDFAVCVVESAPHYLDSGKNPKYGTTTISVTQSDKIVFAGKNIGAYFKIAKKTMLQIDDGPSLAINPDHPVDAAKTIEAMKKGKEVKVSTDFGPGGGVSVHVFNLSGFSEAYKKMISGKKI